MKGKIRLIAFELRNHAPFTIFGAFTGLIILFILFYGNYLLQISSISRDIFYILHPIHIFSSALVTTTVYIRYSRRTPLFAFIIGYTGSIGISTISDSIIPFIGEVVLNLPNADIHIGLIEEPLLTNIPAIIGILFGYFKGYTKFPHAGHVLISTWASLFHIIMALGLYINLTQIILIFIFLFFAVWIPCCTSDIVYPIIFKNKNSI
jgi:hypothetical protein